MGLKESSKKGSAQISPKSELRAKAIELLDARPGAQELSGVQRELAIKSYQQLISLQCQIVGVERTLNSATNQAGTYILMLEYLRGALNTAQETIDKLLSPKSSVTPQKSG